MKVVIALTSEQVELLDDLGFKHIFTENVFQSNRSYITDLWDDIEHFSSGLERYKNRDYFYIYEGDAVEFVKKHAPLIKMVHRDNVGAILRPIFYQPDNERLRWYEDEESYLMSRGTLEEFKSAYMLGSIKEIPNRFSSSLLETSLGSPKSRGFFKKLCLSILGCASASVWLK